MYHNPKERCPFNPCLLGHDKAREALKASKAFGRIERLAKQQEELLKTNTPNKEDENHNQAAALLQNTGNPNQTLAVPPTKPQENPPVDFQAMLKETDEIGKRDEFKRMYELTESLKNDFNEFKKQAAEK